MQADDRVPLFITLESQVSAYLLNHALLFIGIAWILFCAYQLYDEFYRVKHVSDEQDAQLIDNYLYMSRRYVLRSKNETNAPGGLDERNEVQEVQE